MTESLEETHERLGMVVIGDAIERPETLALLVESCGTPLHRWFTTARQKILALALDAMAAGTVKHDQMALCDYLSQIRWQDALDHLKGRPLVLTADQDFSTTALAGIGGYVVIGDVLGARSADIMVFGQPARTVAILRNVAQRRMLIDELTRTAGALGKVRVGEDASPILTGLSGLIREHSGMPGERSMGQALVSAIGQAEREAELRAIGKGRNITWGVASLDALIPLKIGRLALLSGRPGGGKTSLALQAADATSRALGKRSVALLSLEMSAEELAMVLACRGAQIPRRQAEDAWETLTEPDRQELRALAAQWTEEGAMWVRDAAAGKPTVEAVIAWIRNQKNRHHGALQLVVIDYLALIKASNPRAALGDRFGEITSSLKQIALAEGVCILLLAQMTREGRKPGRGTDGKVQADPEPRNEDLFGGSSVENDADSILFLHALPEEGPDYRFVDALLTKNRKGPMGRAPLVFFGAHQHFQEREESPDNSAAARDRAERTASRPSDGEDVF